MSLRLRLREKVGDFWLPAHNQWVTKVRLGGTAKLTIDYFNYKVWGTTLGNAALSEFQQPVAEGIDSSCRQNLSLSAGQAQP
jgi:hypothetical protein